MGWTPKAMTAQVGRLRALPRNEEAQPWKVLAPEYERVLGSVADTDGHLEKIVTHVLDSAKGDKGRFCPTPAELRDLASDVSAAPAQPDPACPKCDGSGWQFVKNTFGDSGVKKCDCWAKGKETAA